MRNGHACLRASCGLSVCTITLKLCYMNKSSRQGPAVEFDMSVCLGEHKRLIWSSPGPKLCCVRAPA